MLRTTLEMMVPAVADLTGWRFDPVEEEVIEHYLVPKVRGEQKPHLRFIPELDVYATEPWNLGSKFHYLHNLSNHIILLQECHCRVN